MSARFAITLSEAEGAAIRVLGLVERRGWTIHAATLEPPNGGKRRLALIARPRDGARDPRVLRRQLERLFDVEAVIVEMPSAAAEPAHADQGA
ncbi:MAG: ACT domain-containing protein [Caulobacterales bacterium]|nr:ACT domain-containing protein [Caulobacterales bacterium]